MAITQYSIRFQAFHDDMTINFPKFQIKIGT